MIRVLRPVIAWLLITWGLWALPLGYFLGFNTSSYPTWVKLALGSWGIAAGIGLLGSRRWAAWLGAAFLATQLVSVSVPGFGYDALFSVGFNVKVPVEGGLLVIQLNVLALLMIVGLLIASAGRSSPRA